MRTNRRDVLRTSGLLLAGVGLAGCTASEAESGGDSEGTTESTTSADGADASAGLAVAAEWNVMRARAYDGLALGIAGEADAGARVAADVLARFEESSGAWSAHETLEETSHEHYEEFEEAIEELAEAGLGRGDRERAETEADLVNEHLGAAQAALVGEANARALDLLTFGARVADAALLAAAERFDAAATVGSQALSAFEDAEAHEALEEADREAYEAFEHAIEGVVDAAKAKKPEQVRARADEAASAAVTGAYAIAGEDQAGAGHIALLQGGAFDAAALASFGGPGAEYAHACTLSGYRARVRDAAWLATAGETEVAKRALDDLLAHFEDAEAHEALEETNHEAYEGFEGGVEALAKTIADGGDVAEAVATVDGHLVAGVEALAPGVGAAILESAFFRSRVADARERYRLGETTVAATIGEELFEAFERDEAGFHEAFEEADHEGYESFEDHLESLVSAFESGDDAAVRTHGTAVRDALLGFGATVGTSAQVAVAESSYVGARGFDAATLAELGETERARTVIREAEAAFEENRAHFHESIEEADHETYESFESSLSAVGSAAKSGGDVSAEAAAFHATTVEAAYAVVAAAGGSFGPAAAAIGSGLLEAFENARAHERLEAADHEAYEAFESALKALVDALKKGSDATPALDAFATAAIRAEFAVVGAGGKAPAGGSSH